MSNKSEQQEQNKIELIINTTQGKWVTAFPKTTKVRDVISAIIKHFGYSDSNSNYQLSLEDSDDELDPNRPLVSYGIEDNQDLFFTDLGVAV